MPKQTAGVLLYRTARAPGASVGASVGAHFSAPINAGSAPIEVLLAHPGGPLWAKRDLGVWTIPKGQFGGDEQPLDAARREFEEEMGSAPAGEFVPLGTIKQPSGKVVYAFAAESDFDVATVNSNLFSMEWPPKSGRRSDFPEVDRAGWFSIEDARRRISKGQEPFLDRLLALLNS